MYSEESLSRDSKETFMPLFDEILGAVNNPAMQGNSDQLSSILGTVQSLAGSHGADSSATQAMMSIVGNQVKSSLQQHRATNGQAGVESILSQFGGLTANPGALAALFSPDQQQQMTQQIAGQTGMNAGAIQAMLPIVVPLVLNMLNSGASAQPNAPAGTGGNPVLNAFLDTDGDGDTDIGDMMSMATRFLGR